MKSGAPSAPGRRARERERHRREILAAAERVFAAKGYETATVEEIVREAEFATGTLYKFFDGKEALFLAVADRILDDLIARFDAEVEPLRGAPRQAIERYVAIRLNEVATHEAFLHVYYPVLKARCRATPRTPDAARRRKIDRFRSRVVALFEEGARQGVTHAVPAEELLAIVEGSVRFFAKLWSRPDRKAPSAVEQHRILERSLLALLWAHPTQGTPP